MTEKKLRQAHRNAGIPLALFVLLQTASGIVLSIEDLFGTYFDTILRDIHTRFGYAGSVYRIALGVCLLWMVFSGLMINHKIRARQKAASL
jgi:hypothetical protein